MVLPFGYLLHQENAESLCEIYVFATCWCWRCLIVLKKKAESASHFPGNHQSGIFIPLCKPLRNLFYLICKSQVGTNRWLWWHLAPYIFWFSGTARSQNFDPSNSSRKYLWSWKSPWSLELCRLPLIVGDSVEEGLMLLFVLCMTKRLDGFWLWHRLLNLKN